MTRPDAQPRPARSGTTVTSAGLTDRGKVRDSNEDAFAIDEALGLFLVSDGMGGERAGEKASAAVAQVLPLQMKAALEARRSVDEDTGGALLCNNISDLSQQIFRRSRESLELRGMGATVVACLLHAGTATIAHMGDSRAYLLRSRQIEQVTEDHTLAALLLRLGKITKRQAATHPGRHALSRFVGMEGEAAPDVSSLSLRKGDLLLLCTDGLTNMVRDQSIRKILRQERDLKKACKELVAAANEAGGSDNVTVLLVQYGERSEERRRASGGSKLTRRAPDEPEKAG